MALMYAFLKSDRWNTLQVQESQSYTFCFSDCACQMADRLKKKIDKMRSKTIEHHPKINSIIQGLGNILQNPVTDTIEARDAILALICHNVALSCQDKNNHNILTPTPPEIITNDVIYVEASNENQVKDDEQIVQSLDDEPMIGCIDTIHIDSLMAFTRWQITQNADSLENHHLSMLRAYGFTRQLMNFILKMISGEKLKFVLYSGHERTLQNFGSALGLPLDLFISYASRLLFEVYKSTRNTQFYFRIIYNGMDITNRIHFCKGEKSLRISRGHRKNNADLCPIENLIRFIHDDYFQSLNVTNFKDACFVKENDLNNLF